MTLISFTLTLSLYTFSNILSYLLFRISSIFEEPDGPFDKVKVLAAQLLLLKFTRKQPRPENAKRKRP
jgi:hypothetical protein